MKKNTIELMTSGEDFYDITSLVKNISLQEDGVLHLFVPHTSCALCISEAFDPSAKNDVCEFMKHLAPRNLAFITHTAEGEDDSPSHMKSVLLHQSLSLIVENSKIVLGQWQGIYLAEFRDSKHCRKLHYKYLKDPI
jgi:secondary thiamine-phosphate synthase enzyme